MADGLVCDACGATLLLEADVRYVLHMDGRAAYDPMELTREDLERDTGKEWRAILDSLSALSAEEAQDQVHRCFDFDLCPRCWRRFLTDPLRGLRASDARGEGS